MRPLDATILQLVIYYIYLVLSPTRFGNRFASSGEII